MSRHLASNRAKKVAIEKEVPFLVVLVERTIGTFLCSATAFSRSVCSTLLNGVVSDLGNFLRSDLMLLRMGRATCPEVLSG